MNRLKTYSAVTATSAVLLLSGCVPSVEDAGGTAGSDSLKITQNGNGYTLEWDKKSDGYSEVGIDSGSVGEGERADTLVVSDNYDGKHTLACAVESYSSSSVSVGCYGDGPDFMGGTREIEKHFPVYEGTLYAFYLTYGAMSSERRSDDSGYRLRYSDGALIITKP